ncbi:MAG: hypothetical protein CMG69_03985 [Candidatus Marinimicrobia bacterium]|nr:hypothetical protein [Candidatus Neomarinimicrobiota bacterium]|tara:strand:+ start:42048 stop:42791 length:744 start_codon:yes stop_codon:yes gene_type:complete
MKNTSPIDNFYNVLVENNYIKSRDKAERKFRFLFKNLDFTNKSVLDIGGGIGISSFYMASMGAREVINIEPEGAGSRTGMIEKFDKIKSQLNNVKNVLFQPDTFQTFDPKGKKFDIILLDQSINHLDESACTGLLNNKNDRKTYIKIFEKIASITLKKSKLVICDCSRYNFFNLLNIKNPIAPSIEWEKHQSPETWIELLKEVGFGNPTISWRSNDKFGKFGEIFFANKLTSFFFNSKFDFIVEKNL